MDEMRLLQRLGDETELPTAERLSRARIRLTTEMAAMPAQPSGPSTLTVPSARPRRSRPARRLVFGGLASAGLAAALAAVLVLAPDQLGGSTPAARADATQILRTAATNALRQPDVDPRPAQFVYTRSEPGRREIWQSVDGTRDGLIVQDTPTGRRESIPLPGCRNGRMAVIKGSEALPGVTEACTPSPAYRNDLPTDSAAMRAFLIERSRGDINNLGKSVYTLLTDYLPPRTRAALYEAAATTPGLQVVENVKDGAGRSGIGITWPSPTPGGPQFVIVFHPETYALLGAARSGVGTAVLAHTIVDRVGQKA